MSILPSGRSASTLREPLSGSLLASRQGAREFNDASLPSFHSGMQIARILSHIGSTRLAGQSHAGSRRRIKLQSSTLTSRAAVKRLTGIVCRTVGTVNPSRTISGASPVCSTSGYFRQLIYQLVERDRIVSDADAGRVVDCVRDRRRHAAEAKLANALGLHG